MRGRARSRTASSSVAGAVKEKMRTHSGTGSAFMHLTLLDDNNQARPPPHVLTPSHTLHPLRHTPRASQVVADLSDDSLKLGFYSPADGWTLHITDLDPHSISTGGGLEDVTLVKKYEISEEDYLKRENNFRAWKEEQQKRDPNWTFARHIKDRQVGALTRAMARILWHQYVAPLGPTGCAEDEGGSQLCA